jgi:hypothetical protein
VIFPTSNQTLHEIFRRFKAIIISPNRSDIWLPYALSGSSASSLLEVAVPLMPSLTIPCVMQVKRTTAPRRADTHANVRMFGHSGVTTLIAGPNGGTVAIAARVIKPTATEPTIRIRSSPRETKKTTQAETTTPATPASKPDTTTQKLFAFTIR